MWQGFHNSSEVKKKITLLTLSVCTVEPIVLKYGYFIRIINEWNSLPNDIKESVSISVFEH